MSWVDIEKMVNRSFHLSFSKNKFFFIFPAVAFCGIFANLFRALSSGATSWLKLSFSFLPAFIVGLVLLGVGVVLVRAYYYEIKKIEFSYLSLIKKSWDLIISLVYVTFPISTIYVTLWSVIGFLYFMQDIPGIGFVINIFMSFVPFLLVLSFIVLSIAQIVTIFILAPTVAIKSYCSFQLVLTKMIELKNQLLHSCILFFISIFPVVLVLSFLFLASYLTDTSSAQSFASFLFYKSVFTSLVFSALCSPCVAFFFNVSTESYLLLQKNLKRELS